MNLSAVFIRRPVATVLLTIGIALAGVFGFLGLAVAPLPNIDLPTIAVFANLPGASPETMASSVATPLERRLGTIAAVDEMTSRSSQGSTQIIMQFAGGRDINGAARDIQAAINASRADLPATLRSNPTYRKFNPADQPIIILALTSATRTPQQVYDAASNILQQRILQVPGVGDVELGGGSLPAVRVELNPFTLARLGIGFEDVRAAIAAANGNRPKGTVEGGGLRYQIFTNDQSRAAATYRPLIVAYRNGAPVRLQDVATVDDGPEDLRTSGQFNGRPAVIGRITRAPGANIIEVVDAIRAQLPGLQAALPADIKLEVASERTRTIRASLREVEYSLLASILLVVLVVGAFLRSWRATLVPAVAIVVSLLGTLAAMDLLGLSLNNLSLMALVVATGFVVDDAVVVLENIARHVEDGMPRFEAALQGAREVGFTVLSMSISLVAVFIPLFFLGGIPGAIFSEFALVMSLAIAISLVVSLTTTPMLAARLLRPAPARPGRLSRALERGFARVEKQYERSLDWALAHRRLTMLMLVATIGLNVFLYANSPSGLFPTQDSGQLFGGLRADQSISFEQLDRKLTEISRIVRSDPAVDAMVAFTGGRSPGGAFVFINLKPQAERVSSEEVVRRLRPKLMRVPGTTLFLNPVQDLRVGGRQGNATYQYTLVSDDLAQLRLWTGKLAAALKQSKVIIDVDSDQEDRGVETAITIDYEAAARLGLSNRAIASTLYDAFGQRQVATIYNDVNQYKVVMEVAPEFARDPSALRDIYVSGASTSGVSASAFQIGASGDAASAVSSGPAVLAPGTGPSNALAPALAQATGVGGAVSGGSPLAARVNRSVPLSAIASSTLGAAPTAVNHQNTDAAATISYNVAPGKALSDAQAEIARVEAEIGMPTSVRGADAGTAKAFAQSFSSVPLLIVAALGTIYLVLGILYESTIHPITVLSTLPSAGVGALMALLLAGMELDLIGIVGIILLIGIVKKNAILIIDFALEAERHRGMTSLEAIRAGAILRFRPILMTTLAAILGALPLAIGFGEGSELRQPLGVAIIGGLIASQLLTLITTPVVFLYLDRLRRRRPRRRDRVAATGPALVPAE